MEYITTVRSLKAPLSFNGRYEQMYCIECGKELGIYEFDKCILCKEKDKVLKESSEDNATNTWGE